MLTGTTTYPHPGHVPIMFMRSTMAVTVTGLPFNGSSTCSNQIGKAYVSLFRKCPYSLGRPTKSHAPPVSSRAAPSGSRRPG